MLHSKLWPFLETKTGKERRWTTYFALFGSKMTPATCPRSICHHAIICRAWSAPSSVHIIHVHIRKRNVNICSRLSSKNRNQDRVSLKIYVLARVSLTGRYGKLWCSVAMSNYQRICVSLFLCNSFFNCIYACIYPFIPRSFYTPESTLSLSTPASKLTKQLWKKKTCDSIDHFPIRNTNGFSFV